MFHIKKKRKEYMESPIHKYMGKPAGASYAISSISYLPYGVYKIAMEMAKRREGTFEGVSTRSH